MISVLFNITQMTKTIIIVTKGVIIIKIRIKSDQSEMIEGITLEYPYVLHYVDMKKTVVPWHWHEEVEFNYISSGSIRVLTANQEYVFTENQAFFINTNVLCKMETEGEEERMMSYSHLFDSVFLGGHFKSLFQTKYIEPVLRNRNIDILAIRGTNERQVRLLHKLRQVSFLQHRENVEFQTRNLFSEIWLLLKEEIEEQGVVIPNNNFEKQERMQTMISYIQSNYMDKITLQDIADHALVSKRECIRCFETSIGKTPFEYLVEYRIEAAEKMLRNTTVTIAEIALQAGFSSSAYFSKIFKQKCGQTPREYRNKYMVD